MKSTDKILIAILVGVALLVGVAFAVAFFQPKPEYRAEDTPEGIAYNYILAMQRGDYERAYGYLSPMIPGYPRTVERFTTNVNSYAYYYRNNSQRSYETISSTVNGPLATVKVRETTFYQGDLFSSGESTSIRTMTLSKNMNTGKWGISRSDAYWAYCWNQSKGCP